MSFQDKLQALIEAEGIPVQLEVPPDTSLGDYALPCFPLAKAMKKAPNQIAEDLAKKFTADFLEDVQATGPYVNFFIKKDAFAKATLKEIQDKGSEYGSQAKKNDNVMIEYSQPNTHKAFHVGHLRGTSLGESLARILRFAGYTVVQANYSGDTGAHIAKWLWYYTNNKETPPKENIEQWIANIYVKAVQALADDPDKQAEVDVMLAKLDAKEPGALFDTYTTTRQLSIDAFKRIYKELDAHFDEWFFESAMDEHAKTISNELATRKIAKEDDGAIIMDLEDVNLGIWVLLRKDGTPLYSAKDLALAEDKFKKYNVDRSIYVVGAAQSMHFKQLFETLERMEFEQTDKCFHLSFTEVRLPEGKMSSRTGQNILYSDMHAQVADYATEEIQKRHEDWTPEQIATVVHHVTIAALKYDMLAINPNKTITFDPKNATAFEGETGPYLLYTYARASSILRKATPEIVDGSTLTHEKELALLRALAAFPAAVDRATREYMPSYVAHCAMSIAKTFNSFYHECPVLQEERKDRVALVQAAVIVLGKALTLLGIKAPEEM
ncbi:MAG: arginine--tRNA ligase [Candidatus Woesearchaeota archaeon]|nr:arginine--tRNA ligase [Candidatus Woesearchaeota archaeon]